MAAEENGKSGPRGESESTLSQAVSLLERSVNLLKESAKSNQNDSTVGNPESVNDGFLTRAAINYRKIFPSHSVMDQPATVSTDGASTSGGPMGNLFAGNIVTLSSGTSQSVPSNSKPGAAISGRQSWPGNYQSCKRSFQSTLSSKKSKGKSRFQPYKIKETWTHDFCVLADKDQKKVPSTAYKQKLCEAGLGQKTVVFSNKRGDFKHIQQELFGRFSKLQQARGFELYRQGSNKDLTFIKPPASGYTIPFLKYDYGIKSAIIYVLPIQSNLSLDAESVEEDVDDEDIEKQECYSCCKEIPLYQLREHLKSCCKELSSSSIVQLSVGDETEDEGSAEELPTCSFLESNDRTVCSESEHNDYRLSQLQDMFPQTSTDTLQSTLQDSCDVEDAVNKLLKSDCSTSVSSGEDITPQDLTIILKKLSPKSGVMKRITVSRDYLFTDSICQFKSAKFDFNDPFRITFENEAGIDGGDPKREYFSLLLKELVSLLAPVRLFEGNEKRLLPMHNTDALQGGIFKVAGRMIVSSVINGGPGFPCLAVPVYTYLVSGSVDDAIALAIADDIPDMDVREALNEIDNIENFDNVPTALHTTFVDAGFTKLLTKDNKESAIVSLMIHSIISSRKAELDQLAQGLDPLLREARKVPEMFKPLFVYDPETEKLTAEKLKALLHIDYLQDNLKEYLNKYIDSKGEDELAKLLCFCTGASSIPPLGFIKPSKVSVSSTDSVLPNANTCPMELELPSRNSSFEEFTKQMDMALDIQASGFGVP